MNKCNGIMGKIFGHKFKARYDEEDGSPVWPFTEGSLESRIAVAQGCSVKGNGKSTYVYDVCVRCGEKVERTK